MKNKNIDELERKKKDEFWTNVFIDFQTLAQLIRQEKIRESYELHEKLAVLNCDICKQWEKHFDEWPHNRMTLPGTSPSVITAKAANGYHFKTGHSTNVRDKVFY